MTFQHSTTQLRSLLSLGLFAALSVTSLGCAGAPTENPAPQTETESTPEANIESGTKTQSGGELYGEALDEKVQEVSLTDLIAKPESYTKKTLTVRGIIRANCEKKGCWIDVRPEDDRLGQSLLMRFKGYGFFVPLDSRGSKVRAQGYIRIEEMTAEEVKHHEDEGGTIANKRPDGSAVSMLMIASGVELYDRPTK